MIAALHLDLLKHIATFLENKSIRPFAATCKKFAAVVREVYKKVTENCGNSVIESYKYQLFVTAKEKIAVEVNYIKNTFAGLPLSTKSLSDVRKRLGQKFKNIGPEFLYIDLSHYRNVGIIHVKKKNEELGLLEPYIFIDLPPKCRSLIIGYMYYTCKIVLLENSGGSIIKEIISQTSININNDVSILKTIKAPHFFENFRFMNIDKIFSKFAEIKNLSFAYIEATADGKIIQNNFVKRLEIILERGTIDFALNCPRLRSLTLIIKFAADNTDKNTFTKSGWNKIKETAANLQETFSFNCYKLGIINIEIEEKFSFAKKYYIADIVDDIRHMGFVEVKNINPSDGIKYGRIIVDITTVGYIRIICGVVYINYHYIDPNITEKYILSILDLLKASAKVESGIEEEISVKFKDETYVINKSNITLFSIKRIAAFFKHGGYKHEYPMKYYFSSCCFNLIE